MANQSERAQGASVQRPTTSSHSLVPPDDEFMDLSVQMYTAYNSEEDAWKFLDKKLLPLVQKYLQNQTDDEIGIKLIRLSRQFGMSPSCATKLIKTIEETSSSNLTSECSRRLKIVCEGIYRGMQTHIKNGQDDQISNNSEWIEVVSELVRCIKQCQNSDTIQLVSTFSSVLKLVKNETASQKLRDDVLKLGHLEAEARGILERDIVTENRMKNRRLDSDNFYKDGILTNNSMRVGQTYLIINQTRMRTTTPTNLESERQPFTIVNIKRIMRNKMTSQVLRVESQPMYTETNYYEGDGTSFWKGTHTEIDRLLKDAKAGKPLKEYDLQVYLPEKLIDRHFYLGIPISSCWAGEKCNLKIADIFKLASSKYVLGKEALDRIFLCIRGNFSDDLTLLCLESIKAQCKIDGNLVFDTSEFECYYRSIRTFYYKHKSRINDPKTVSSTIRDSLALAKTLIEDDFQQHQSANELSLKHSLIIIRDEKTTSAQATEEVRNVTRLIKSNPEIFTDAHLSLFRKIVTDQSCNKYLLPQIRIDAVIITRLILINCNMSEVQWKEILEVALKVMRQQELTEELSVKDISNFLTQILCLIYSAFELQSDLVVPRMPILLDSLQNLSGEPLYTLVAVLALLLNNQTTIFNFRIPDKLFEMLMEDIPITISKDGDFCVGRNNEEARSEMLSSYASSIILYIARHGTEEYTLIYHRAALLESVTAAQNINNKQLRINIAEAIYRRKEEIFKAINSDEVPKIFGTLEKLSRDEVPDCRVFGRATLVFFIEKATKEFHSDLDCDLLKSFLQTSALCFCDYEFTLGGESYHEEINSSILATFLELAKHSWLVFPCEAFTVFDEILQAGELYVDDVITILSIYVRNKELTTFPILPSTTINAVESVNTTQLEKNVECVDLLTHCILASQNVSIKFIDILKGTMYDNTLDAETRDNYFVVFSKAIEMNLFEETMEQELLDILEMENISREALNNFARGSDYFKAQLQLSAATFILAKVQSNSRELTLKNYEWMDTILNCNQKNETVLKTQQNVLEIITLAIENNQDVPESLVENTIVGKLLSPQINPVLLSKICQFFTARHENNKSFIRTLPGKLESILKYGKSGLDDFLFFEVCLLFFKTGRFQEPIDESIFLETISKFHTAISKGKTENNMLETMSRLCSYLPNSENLNKEVNELALDIFLNTKFFQLGLQLVYNLPSIDDCLVEVIIKKSIEVDQQDTNYIQQVLDLLKSYSIRDKRLERKLLRLSETKPEMLLEAIQEELDEEDADPDNLYTLSFEFPFLLEHHSDPTKVRNFLIQLLDEYEQTFLRDREGMFCNVNFWSALMEMLIKSIESNNEEKCIELTELIENIIKKCSKLIEETQSQKVLIKDCYVTKLLNLLQNCEAMKETKFMEKIKKVIRLIKKSSMASKAFSEMVRIKNKYCEASAEEKDSFRRTIEEIKTASEEVMLNSLWKFEECLTIGNDYLANLENLDVTGGIYIQTTLKIHDCARLLALCVTRGLSRKICGESIWIQFVEFMKKYATFVMKGDSIYEKLCEISGEALTAIGIIFQVSAKDDNVDYTSLASILDIIASKFEFSDNIKSFEYPLMVVQASSMCAKHYNQENYQTVNKQKINMLQNLYNSNNPIKLIRYYSFTGLFYAYQKIEDASNLYYFWHLLQPFMPKIGDFSISLQDVSKEDKMNLLRSSILVSEEIFENCQNSTKFETPLSFRAQLLSSELLKILTKEDIAQARNISEVIEQINSKVSHGYEIKRIGSIYENILVIILWLEIQGQNSSLTADILELLTCLNYVGPMYLQKEHIFLDRIVSLENELKIEAVRGILVDKLQTGHTTDEEKLNTVLRFSRTLTQKHGDNIAMALVILNSVEKFTEKELDDLESLMEFLRKENIQVKLSNIVHYDSFLSCSREIFTIAVMKNRKFRRLEQKHIDRLEIVKEFLLHRKTYEDTSLIINLAFDRNLLFSDRNWTDFFRVLVQFPDKLLDQNWEKIIKFLRNENSSKWLKGINYILVEGIFRPFESNVLNLEQVVEKFSSQNATSSTKQEDLYFKITQSQYHSKLLWSKDFNNLNTLEHSREEELIPLLIAASRKVYGYDLTDNQILSLFLAAEERNKTGLLQQIETGGGKSPIIRLTAIMKCLLHKKPVLVATSNLDLARRDARECTKLARFFNLTVDHNADQREYIAGTKNCYKCDIIYIEPSQMAFDILRHEYSQLNTLGDFEPEIILIDEVDSMLIDDSSKSARLTSEIPGMEFLQPIYHILWNRAHVLLQRLILIEKNGVQRKYFVKEKFKENFENIQHFEEAMKSSNSLTALEEFCDLISDDNEESIVQMLCGELEAYLNEKLNLPTTESAQTESPKFNIPKHLEKFVKSQTKRWPLSLLTALSYTENIHYIVKDELIQPVEFDTSGVIRMNQNWSNGIHQFLQIKHNVPFVPESLPTNFLSSVGFFKKFKPKNTFGYTGTCGSAASKELLNKCYKLEIVEIPSRYASKKLHQYPDLEVSHKSGWTSSITDSVELESKKGRATLVVCRTIREAKSMYAQLKNVPAENKVTLYARNSEHEERKIQRIDSGEVIVATLLAGRGTDIKTSRNVEANGGLHLIVTFIPQNQRAEDQILGRTGRMGKCGTAQFILLNNQESNCKSNVSKSLREQRDEKERIMLQEFMKKSLPLIELKDELFEEFCTSLENAREQIKKDISVKDKIKRCFGISIPTAFEKGVVSCFEEEWAYFALDMESCDDISENSKRRLRNIFIQIKTDFFSKLEQSLKEKYEEKALIFQYTEPITKTERKSEIISNPFHAIQVGNEYAKRENFKAAEIYYNRAIQIEPELASAAYQGLAWCNLEDKLKSIKCLEKALKCLAEEKGILELCYQPGADKSEKTLQAQIICTIDLIGNHINSVHTDLNTIKKSQRFVDICRKSSVTGNEIEDIEVQRAVKNVIPDPFYTIYDVTFHDLSVENGDLNKQNDQLLRVAHSFKNYTQEIVLPLANASLLYSMTAEIINERGLTKNHALSLLEDSWKDKIKNKAREWIGNNSPPEDIVACTIYSNRGQQQILRDTTRANVKSQIKEALENSLIDLSIKDRPVRSLIENQEFHVILLGVDYEDFDEILGHAQEKNKCKLCASGTPNDLEAFLIACDGLKVNLFCVAENSSSIVKRNFFKVKGNSKPPNWHSVKSIQVPIQNGNFTIQENCTKSLVLNLCISSATSNQLAQILELHKNKLVDVFMPIQKEQLSTFSEIVETFRKANFEMDLKISNLTYDEAVSVIKTPKIKTEEIEAKRVKNVMDYYCKGHIPQPLYLLLGRGLEFHLSLNEKLFVPWFSVCTVAGLGALQIIAGSTICLTGLGTTIGAGFIKGGCADLVYTHRVYSTRRFNLKAYVIRKTLSIGLSCATFGLGAFAYLGNVGTEAVEPGSVELLVNGKEVGTCAKNRFSSMVKFVGKNISVGIAEASARETIFNATNAGTTILMEYLELGIKDSLTRSLGIRAVEVKENEKLNLLTCLNRLDLLCQIGSQNRSLLNTVSHMLNEIMNSSPKQQEALKQTGANIIGSVFSVVSSLPDLINLCDKTCSQITQKLTEFEIENFNIRAAVRLATKQEDLEVLGDMMENILHNTDPCECTSPLLVYDLANNHPNFYEKITDFIFSDTGLADHEQLIQPAVQIVELLYEIKAAQEEESKKPCYLEARHSKIARLIVDTISRQLTNIIQNKMMNPALNMAGSALVNVASEYLQDQFNKNFLQSSSEQIKNEQNYKSIQEKILNREKLTSEEIQFYEFYSKARSSNFEDGQTKERQDISMKLRNTTEISESLEIDNTIDFEEFGTTEKYME